MNENCQLVMIKLCNFAFLNAVKFYWKRSTKCIKCNVKTRAVTEKSAITQGTLLTYSEHEMGDFYEKLHFVTESFRMLQVVVNFWGKYFKTNFERYCASNQRRRRLRTD